MSVIAIWLVFIVWLGSISAGLAVTLGLNLSAAWFPIGVVIGGVVMWLDERWFSRWYHAEHLSKTLPESTSPAINNLKAEYFEPISQLITRSLVVGLVYLVLAGLLLTSVGSLLGLGVVLSMLIIFTLEMWQYGQHRRFNTRFGNQLKRPLSPEEIKGWQVFFTGSSLLLSFLVLL